MTKLTEKCIRKNIKYSDIWLTNAVTIVPCVTIPQKLNKH